MRNAPAWFAVLLILVCSCDSGRAPGPAPNILLVSIDTLRRDHVSAYGYGRETTPRIDKIAGGGTLFENAVSTSSWTLPAHTSMLTGLYPAFHGLQNDGHRLPPSVPTLAEALRDAGYYTMAVVGHVYVSSEFGLDRGFDRFEDSLIRRGAENPTADQIVDRAIGIFASLDRRPFFAFLHFFDPHWDYAPPRPYDERFTDPLYRGPIDGTLASLGPYVAGDQPMAPVDRQRAIDLYDGEIAFTDAQIGRLYDWLEARGMLDNTVIVITADHGEEFLEHGRLGHGKTLFDEQIRVPLVVAGHPAFPAGKRRTDTVSLVDIAPTLLDLAGAAPPDGLQGYSLATKPKGERRYVVSESIRYGNEMRAIQNGHKKLIHVFQGDAHHYYDLDTDPNERRSSDRDPTDGELTRRLAEYAASADRGWHLKLIALGDGDLRCRGTVSVAGSILRPRKYFSGSVEAPSRVEFDRFELNDETSELSFDVDLAVMMGEIAFETTPPGAPVTFTIETGGSAEGAGVFLGKGERIDAAEGATLVRDDPRLDGLPADYVSAAPGCYIRTVRPPDDSGRPSDLTEEARERLRALGYLEEEGAANR